MAIGWSGLLVVMLLDVIRRGVLLRAIIGRFLSVDISKEVSFEGRIVVKCSLWPGYGVTGQPFTFTCRQAITDVSIGVKIQVKCPVTHKAIEKLCGLYGRNSESIGEIGRSEFFDALFVEKGEHILFSISHNLEALGIGARVKVQHMQDDKRAGRSLQRSCSNPVEVVGKIAIVHVA